MVIGMDGRALAARRGVARYARRMAEQLARLAQLRALVPDAEHTEPVAGAELRGTGRHARLVYAAGALAGRPRIDRLLGGPDVTWLPAPAPAAVGGRYVLTVHDLSWEERPADFTRYERVWHRLARPRRLARAAAAVLADAPPVADLVRERWGVEARVVEPGIDHVPAEPHPGRYFLYVGALDPRKGLDVLAEAWREAAVGGAELLVAGEGRVGVPGARMLGHVSDEQLHSLYAGALAVVLPSRLEGYGFPPREAAAHGTPSIVTDIPTLRLPGTIRVPPGDSGALADALGRLPAERERLVAELPPRRTWEDAAAELLAVLEEAAVS